MLGSGLGNDGINSNGRFASCRCHYFDYYRYHFVIILIINIIRLPLFSSYHHLPLFSLLSFYLYIHYHFTMIFFFYSYFDYQFHQYCYRVLSRSLLCLIILS